MPNRIFFITGITESQLERFSEDIRLAAQRGAKSIMVAVPYPEYIHILEFNQDDAPTSLTLSEFAEKLLEEQKELEDPDPYGVRAVEEYVARTREK